MERIIIIGPGGAGKSEMSRKLRDILNLPLYHLDNIFWKEDKTHVSKEEFDIKLNELLSKDKWIIEGDYSRTLETRMKKADTVIFLDYSLEVCLSGVENRIGKPRPDIPWVEDEFDPEFKEWIINWFKNKKPIVLELLEKYKDSKNIIVLHSRKEGDIFVKELEKNPFPKYYEGVPIEDAKLKVMFIGNSITVHEVKPELGWFWVQGMAASSLENDYVHHVIRFLKQKEDQLSVYVYSGKLWELDYWKFENLDYVLREIEQYQPNILVLRIGENTYPNMQKYGYDLFPTFNRLVEFSKQIAKYVFVTSLFWRNDIIDDVIFKATKQNGAFYVDIGDLNLPENKAIGLFENVDVANHPGDLGMKRIGERIIDSLEENIFKNISR